MNRGKSILNSVLLGNKSYLILAVLVIALSIMSPLFLTPSNLLSVLRQVTVSAIVCAGFTLLLGSGHMDLSVGMILCACGVVCGKLLVAGMPIWFAILVTVVAGGLMGAINAGLITLFALPAFIVTLATSSVYKGVAFLVTKNVPVSGLPDAFNFIGKGYWLGIPVPIYVMVLALLVMWVILNRTVFGRQAISMGGNAEATRVSGVRVGKLRVFCYMAMGIFTGLAAVIQTARSASAQLSAGADMTMDAIAAVVIGGTSMKGGNANIVGSLVGCLIVGIVNNGLNLMHVDANWQIVAKGLLILMAVILDSISTKMYKKSAAKKSAA
ncbi:ABC transporter permease [Feifania hominis]|uniref:ABC transporter permease n=1 Tax=Feifania hominis TaxID=2763660 RepID=A0A926DG00_9FIRM|nr:ABC transporter permease [Feifania hominis]MBC8537147.1 ABC transporter permease [Feifania hominis]